MLKFRLSAETRHAATNINTFISSKIGGIGFLHNLYTKLIDYIYKFATQNPGQWCVCYYFIVCIISVQNADHRPLLHDDDHHHTSGDDRPPVYVTRPTSPGNSEWTSTKPSTSPSQGPTLSPSFSPTRFPNLTCPTSTSHSLENSMQISWKLPSLSSTMKCLTLPP